MQCAVPVVWPHTNQAMITCHAHTGVVELPFGSASLSSEAVDWSGDTLARLRIVLIGEIEKMSEDVS